MKEFFQLLAIIVALVIISGCATLFAPKTQSLGLSSEPGEAEVFVNGSKMGVTPLELELKANKSYIIEFSKMGYQSITRVVNTKVGAGWVVLDVLGGLIPAIVDAATGAWYKLDQDIVNALLEKQNK